MIVQQMPSHKPLPTQVVLNAAHKAYKAAMTNQTFSSWLEYQKSVVGAYWSA